MATPEQIIQLRLDLGGLTVAQLSDDQAEVIVDKIALQYPTGSAAVLEAAQWVKYLEGRMASWGEQTSYTQNQESVSQSDAFKAMMQLLAYWQRKLADALEDDAEAVTGISPPPSGSQRLRPVW